MTDKNTTSSAGRVRASDAKQLQVVQIPALRKDVAQIQVVDADLVITLKSKRKVVVRDGALRSLTDDEFTVVFEDESVSGKTLFQEASSISSDGSTRVDLVSDPSAPSADGAVISAKPAEPLPPIPVEPKSSNWSSGWLIGGLLLAAVSKGGGGGGSTGASTSASTVPTETFKLGVTGVAGPLINEQMVMAFDARGNLIATGTMQNGNANISLPVGYAGPLMVAVADINGSIADYVDEATGRALSLGTTLRAFVDVAAGTKELSLSITPITEIAVKLAIKSGKMTDPPTSETPLTSDAVNQSNSAVAQAFGLSNILDKPTPVIGADGNKNANYNESDGLSEQEKYGQALAKLSGNDLNSGSVDKTTLEYAKSLAPGGSGQSGFDEMLQQGAQTFAKSGNPSSTNANLNLPVSGARKLLAPAALSQAAADQATGAIALSSGSANTLADASKDIADGIVILSATNTSMVLPVAISAQAIVGDQIILTIPASNGGTLQTVSYIITNADIVRGYAQVTVSSAQLAKSGAGDKAISARVTGSDGADSGDYAAYLVNGGKLTVSFQVGLYADDKGSLPVLADYTALGVTGVDSTNINALNSALATSGVTAVSVGSAAQIQSLVDAYKTISNMADGTAGNTATLPTEVTYAQLGITGATINTASKLSLLGNVLDAKQKIDIDNVNKIQLLADAVDAVHVGAAGGSSATLAQLQALGIQGVTTANLSAVQNAIAATANDGSGVDSFEKLNTLVTSVVIGNALSLIKTYAENNSGTPPTVAEFTNLGITGVTSTNLNAINTALASNAITGSSVDSATKIQQLVNSYNSVLALSDGIANANDLPIASAYISVGIASSTVDKDAKVALLGRVLDTKQSTDIDTVAKIQSFADAVSAVVAGAAAAGVSPVTLPHLQALGFTGVTNANLSAVQAAIAATADDGSGVNTLEKLNVLVSSAMAGSALTLIKDYADVASGIGPTITDYINLGITGVTSSNLSAVNSVLATVAITGSNVDTKAKVQELVDAYKTISTLADGTVNTVTPPSADTYIKLGVTATYVDNAAKLSLLGKVLDAKQSADVDSAAKIQALAEAVNAVVAGAANGTPANLAQLQALGISGVTATNLSTVQAAIAATADDGSAVATVEKLNSVVSAAVYSLKVIEDYAQSNVGTAPELAEYSKLGITGVTASNLAAINSALASDGVTRISVDSVSKVQALVDAYRAISAMSDGTSNNTTALPDASTYMQVGVSASSVDTATKLNLLGKVIDSKQGTETDTAAKIQALAEAASAVITGAAGGTLPTLPQLQLLGIKGVTPANLSIIQNTIAATANDGSEVDSFDKLNSLVSNVLVASALSAIKTYADADGGTAPTTTDFVNLNISNVTETNLSAINSALASAAVTSVSVDSASKVQTLVNHYVTILAMADGTTNTINIPSASAYIQLGISSSTVDNEAKVNLLGKVLDAKKITDVDTIAKIQALANVVDVVVKASAGGPLPNLTQLQALGLTGVTSANLSAIQNAIADSADDGSAVDSLAKLQTMMSAIVQIPTLTLSTDSGTGTGAGSDGITNVGTVVVSNLVTGATWKYSTDSGKTWAIGSGSAFTVPVGSYGVNAIQVKQTDLVGNTSNVGTLTQAITVDTSAADLTLNLVTDTGLSVNDGITNVGVIKVSGVETGAIWHYSTDSGTSWTEGSSDYSFSLTANTTYAIGQIQVKQKDVAGNTSFVNGKNTSVINFDKTVSAPILALDSDSGISGSDGITNVNKIKVTGIELGATWEYSTNSGINWTSGITSNGESSFTLANGSFGVNSIQVRQKDAAGNISEVGKNTAAITIDTSAAPPTFILVTDSGSSAIDGNTNLGTVRVSGIEDGATWHYSIDSGTTWNLGAINANGERNFVLAEADYAAGKVKVRQTDKAGNQSDATSNTSLIKVDVSVATPTLTLNQDTGTSGTDGITKTGTVNVSGIEIGATWRYSTDSGKNWSTGSGNQFTLPVGTYGVNAIQVKQIDLAGNESSTVGVIAQTITVDQTIATPVLKLLVDSGVSATDGITNVNTVTVEGLETGATWEYSLNGGTTWQSGSLSSFTLSETTYAAGAIKVRQTDKAGNTNDFAAWGTNTSTITVDTTAVKPSFSLVVDSGENNDGITNIDGVKVTGLEFGGTWKYTTDAGQTWSTGTGDTFTLASGTYAANLIQVEQVDNAGNKSAVFANTNAITIDKVAFTPGIEYTGKKTVGAEEKGVITVTNIEVGATWQYSTNSGVGAWTTGSGNSFLVDLKLYAANSIQVRQYDKAGNPSQIGAITEILNLAPTQVPPNAPSFTLLTDSGTNSGDNITNVGTFKVTGLLSGSTWDYSTDGGRTWQAGGAQINGESTFTLAEGKYAGNTIQVRQTNVSNVVSDKSTITTDINIDKTVVTPTPLLVTDSGTGNGRETDGITNVRTIRVTGIEDGASWQYSLNGGTSWITGASEDFTFAVAANTEYAADQIQVKQTDKAGNVSVSGKISKIIKVDTTAAAPTLSLQTDSGVSNSDGTTNINVVNVQGLESGATWQYTTDAGQTWTVGSGTAFSLQVGSYAANLIQVKQTDIAGNESLVGVISKVVTVDTTGPSVSSVYISSSLNAQNGTLNTGDQVSVTVIFNEAVTVSTTSGLPRVKLNIGGTDVYATYASGSGSNSLVFTYNIELGRTDANGISITANSLELNNGAITDLAGNIATVTHNSVADNASYMVDTTTPSLTSVGISSVAGAQNGLLNAGDVVTVVASFSEAVMVATSNGIPKVALNINGNTVYANYAGGSGSNNLTFTYTIQADQTDLNGISFDANSVLSNGGTIADAAGNIATLTHSSVSDNSNYKVDNSAPSLNGVSITNAEGAQSGILNVGDMVFVTASFGEAVLVSTVSGTPRVKLNIGGSDVYANYVSGSGTSNLVFAYTIEAGQTDANGISIAANSVQLNSGNITDMAGNTATLLHTSVADNPSYTVDNTAPTVSSIAISNATTGAQNSLLNAGDVVSVTAVFSEVVTVNTTGSKPRLKLNIGGADVYATYVSGSGSNSLVFNYTIQAGQTDTNGISIAANSLELNNGNITDAAGNSATVTHVQINDNGNYKVDTSAPTAIFKLQNDTGSSSTDGVTANARVLVSGVEAGAEVWYSTTGASGSFVKSANAIVNNATYFDLPANATSTLAVKIVDAAGNAGLASNLGLTTAGIVTKHGKYTQSDEFASLAPGGTVLSGTTRVLSVNSGANENYISFGNDGSLTAYFANGTFAQLTGGSIDFSKSAGFYKAFVDRSGAWVITQADDATNTVVRSSNTSLIAVGAQAVIATDKVGILTPTSVGSIPIYTNDLIVTTDTTVSAPTLALSTDSGTSSSDGLTNVGTVTVGGLENGATWEYSTNNGVNWQTGVNAFFTLAASTYAADTIQVRQLDKVGNTSSVAKISNIVTVKTTVASPTVSLATDSGASNSDGVTNVGTMNVSGLENGATWQYSTNSGISWITGSGTTFTLPMNSYAVGAVQVKQIDAAGNTSTIGANTIAIVMDTVANTPAISLVTDSGTSSTDGITNIRTIKVENLENGATWRYSTDGGSTYSTGSGNTFTLAAGTYAANKITVEQTDSAGNKSTALITTVINIDNTVEALTLNLATDSGTSSSDWITNVANVTIDRLESGATWFYSTNGGRNWTAGTGTSFTLLPSTYAADTIQVKQIDAAGNESTIATNSNVIVVDKTVAMPALSLLIDSGTSSTDGITNQRTISVQGLELGGTWRYSIDGGTNWTAGTGSSFFLAPTATYTANKIQVEQTDVAGNVSTVGKITSEITVDTVVAAPTIALATDTGTSNTDGITKTGDITIGNLESGAAWRYSTDAGQTWSTGIGTSFALPSGTYAAKLIQVKQIDTAGNESVVSSNAAVIQVDKDVLAPTLQLALDDGVSGTDGITTSGVINVSGVEAGASWQYSTDNGVNWQTGTSSSFTLATGTYSANSIRVKQTDLAGNTSAEGKIATVISIDPNAVVPPTTPTFALATDSGTSNSDGISNAGIVNVSGLDNGATWEYSVNAGKNWLSGTSNTFTLAEASYDSGVVQVRQTNSKGVKSEIATLSTKIVIDKTVLPLSLKLASDTGANSTDGVTNSGIMTIENLETGATWKYTIDSGANWFDGSNNFFTLTAGTYAANAIQVVQTDLAGNTTLVSTKYTSVINVDTTVLTPSVALATDSGTSTSDGITNVGTLNVGNLENGGTWQYSLDAGKTWISGTGSAFSVPAGSYVPNVIQVRQTDSAGNTSSVGTNTTAISVVTVVAAPTLALAADTGSSNSDWISNLGTIAVGNLSSGSTWKYSLDSGVTWLDGTGTSFTLAASTYSANTIQIKQTDVAGNESAVTKIPVAVNIDKTVGVPTFSLTTDTGASGSDGISSNGAVTVSNLESGATWEYSIDSGKTWVAGSGALFTLSTNTYAVDAVRVRQTDTAGNTSASTTNTNVISIDTSVLRPTVTLMDTGSSTTDGTTNVGKFTITDLEVGASWSYSLDFGANWETGSGNSLTLTAGSTYLANSIQFKQKDLAGNESAARLYASAVTVDTTVATPTIALETDSGTSSTDGTTKVSTVTVSGLENGATWQYTTNAGGTWHDGSGTTFTLAAGTYAANLIQVKQTDVAGNASGVSMISKTIDIDTTPATVSSVRISGASGSQNATLNVGDVVSVTVVFSEAVIVNAAGDKPRIELDIGGSTVYAAYASGSGSNSLVFTYKVEASRTDANGIKVPANGLKLNNGTITDVAGNNATLTHEVVADNADYMVDTAAPTISSVKFFSATGVQNSLLNEGDVVTVVAEFSEAVNVTTTGGSPKLALSIGGTSVQASYASGSGSNRLLFTYTIEANSTDTNGISITASSFNLDGGVITDAAGNAANLTHALVEDNASYKVDTTAPTAPTLSLAIDTGTAGDNITTVGVLNVVGLEAGSSWTYSLDSGTTWQNGVGTSLTLAQGMYAADAIQVKQTDAAGNQSVAVKSVAVTVMSTISRNFSFDSVPVGDISTIRLTSTTTDWTLDSSTFGTPEKLHGGTQTGVYHHLNDTKLSTGQKFHSFSATANFMFTGVGDNISFSLGEKPSTNLFTGYTKGLALRIDTFNSKKMYLLYDGTTVAESTLTIEASKAYKVTFDISSSGLVTVNVNNNSASQVYISHNLGTNWTAASQTNWQFGYGGWTGANGGSAWVDDLSINANITTTASPLVLDLNGDGIQTMSMHDGVMFDIAADGTPVKTGWVDKHDGLLALDLNGDGAINSGAELFGNHMQLAVGGLAKDGWEALAQYDGNFDGEINALDAIYAKLLIWQDTNSDGISQADELKHMAEAGIASINLKADDTAKSQNGNTLRGFSSFTTTDGKTQEMADAWFETESTAMGLAGLVRTATDAQKVDLSLDASANIKDIRLSDVLSTNNLMVVKGDANDVVRVDKTGWYDTGHTAVVDNHTYVLWSNTSNTAAHMMIEQKASVTAVL